MIDRVGWNPLLRRHTGRRRGCADSGHWHRRPPLLTEDNRLTAFSDREVMFFLV
jgi:hypothetical protein